MNDLVYRRETCRLCGSSALKVALPLTPTTLADAYISVEYLHEEQPVYPLDLYLCGDCGFSQLLDIAIPQVIYLDYIYETVSSLGLVDHFRRYADEIAAIIRTPEKALVVDIGSNDGTLLSFFEERGMDVLGVDPARDIARKATASGIETLPKFFTYELASQILNERGPANIVTANNL